MSGMDLTQWLTAQLAEDERLALKSVEQAMVNLNGADAASVADWHVVDRPATGTFVATRDQWDRVTEIVPTYGGAHSEHIAEHDPARVLREVEADRTLLAEYERAANEYPADSRAYDHESTVGRERTATLEWVVRLRATRFSDRPGYRPEWAPTA